MSAQDVAYRVAELRTVLDGLVPLYMMMLGLRGVREGRAEEAADVIASSGDALVGDKVDGRERKSTLNALAEGIAILAFTDTIEAAAEAACVSAHTFRCRTHAARRAALALWFDGETPPSLSRLSSYRRARDRECRHGHGPIAGPNVYVVRRHGRIVETCRECWKRYRANTRQSVA